MDPSIVRPPALGALASVFAKSGTSTFGGGTATIVEIERQIIDRRGWIGRERHQHFRTFLFAGAAFLFVFFGGLSPFRALAAAAVVGAIWIEPAART